MKKKLLVKYLASALVAIVIACIAVASFQGAKPGGPCLRLNAIGLFDVPDTVFADPELECLDLGNEHWTMFPPLSMMVDSSVNNLTELPDSFQLIPNLKILVLNANRLRKLPKSFEKLRKLELLDLSYNSDLVILDEMYKLAKLSSLKELRIIGVNTHGITMDSVASVLGKKVRIISSSSQSK